MQIFQNKKGRTRICRIGEWTEFFEKKGW